ncbi:hypothetical protein EN812_05785 [Mesorhizobium sp. M4B.F.Ca.ET.169.01.1.1]|uniref:hypothetical protein n=1 Tax=Mesorhizobium sp. M4B.F.Ca.ET.169.01.1.1 TaxID=2563949 RepID=UPI001093F9D0|nr:hypothetical protein [Mesorhizobium sp. M4B.F.Ca.ET.169.01.1.1]TGT46848.1 hypothetical protein EN812_05785 [Mesorhizobium sp. M4B.F.Ca.ET.169.01.1.1]
MSRTTVLQLIAAVITIAVLAVLHQGLKWFLDRMSLDYMLGVISGAVVVFLVWFLAERQDRLRPGSGVPSAEQQSTRHTIDL